MRLSSQPVAKWLVRVGLALAILLLVGWNAVLFNLMATTLAMNDFGKFYYSAVLFLDGKDMYGPSPATLIKVSPTERRQFWNMNPPHLHLPLLPLALLPPVPALGIWTVLNLLAFALTLHLIRTEVPALAGALVRPSIVIGLLAFAGTGAVAVTGQLSFLLLLPVTVAWVRCRRQQWILGATYLGIALAVKPFFLIFVPYFLLKRRLGALAGLAWPGLVACALGVAVFGIDSYVSWLRTLGSADWAWASMNGSLLGFLSRLLTDSPYYMPATAAPSLIQPLWLFLVAAIAAATFVAPRGATRADIDRSFALILLASQLISPLGWVYYLWLALGPFTALVTSWRLASEDPSGQHRWPHRLFRLAIPWLMVPLPSLFLFQPSPWATPLIGSSYFWGTLLLWSSVLADSPSRGLPVRSTPLFGGRCSSGLHDADDMGSMTISGDDSER